MARTGVVPTKQGVSSHETALQRISTAQTERVHPPFSSDRKASAVAERGTESREEIGKGRRPLGYH